VSIDLSPETVERIDRLTRKFPIPPSHAEFVQWLIDIALHDLEARATEIRHGNHRPNNNSAMSPVSMIIRIKLPWRFHRFSTAMLPAAALCLPGASSSG
jgi:hypothetical protein